jgi:hypothetical protein
MSRTTGKARFWLALVIFGLTGQVAWVVENMYFNVFIYKMFNASAEAISAMVAASAVAATVTTLFIGALSDKIGKRKIFICGGYLVWGITIWSFSLIRLDVINALFPTVASAAAMGVSLTTDITFVASEGGEGGEEPAPEPEPEPEPVAGWDGPKLYKATGLYSIDYNGIQPDNSDGVMTLSMDVDLDGSEKVGYASIVAESVLVRALNSCVPYVYDPETGYLTLQGVTVGSMSGPETRDITLVVEDEKSTVIMPYATFQSTSALILPEDFLTGTMCLFMMTGDVIMTAVN